MTLASIARGEVADRGERYAAAVEAEAAAGALEEMADAADEAVRALEELSAAHLVNPLVARRLRAAINALKGLPATAQ